MKTYPLLMLFARHGRRLAYALLAAGLACAALAGWHTGPDARAAIALLGALLLALVTRLAAEVIEVLAETLIPR